MGVVLPILGTVVMLNRFIETTTGKGPMDPQYLASLTKGSAKALRGLVAG